MQGVSHFKDIRYTNGITYGEMFLQNEYEMGRYNLDEADVATQRTRFELYEQVRPARRPVARHSHPALRLLRECEAKLGFWAELEVNCTLATVAQCGY